MKMGLGKIGTSGIIFKRKFRWTFEVRNICGNKNVPASFVKVAGRPNLTTEETEINYLNGKTWIPGKSNWETITVNYYDVAHLDNAPLFNWIVSVYDFMSDNGESLYQQASRGGVAGQPGYAGQGILTMYDGCGDALEEWDLNDAWPSAINFQELDYSSSDVAEIELTLRYSQVVYKPLCPVFDIGCACKGCQSGGGNTGGTVNA